MKKRFNTFLFLILLFVSVITIFIIITCSNNELTKIDNNSETRIEVRIHDTPFKLQDKTVEELNITISRMDIEHINGTVESILNEERGMNILDIAKSNPVVLSNVPINPGNYSQLRLVLKDNSTIKVDGEIFEIKIPSGEQSGLKLDGPFNIVSGKLFRLDLDFVAKESVLWTKGQGYKLKPVIEISSTAEILGYFNGSIGGNDLVFELKSDRTFRAKISLYPDKPIYGNYYYSSIIKELKFNNFEIDIEIKNPFTGEVLKTERKKISELNQDAPNEIKIPIKQWSLDTIISIDTGVDNQIIFNRVNDFNFGNGYSYTKLNIISTYPDDSKNGKTVVLELNPVSGEGNTLLEYGIINGNTGLVTFNIENSNFLYTNSIQYYVTGYLFNSDEDLKVDMGYSGKKIVPMVTGANFSEITDNQWQPQSNIVSVIKDVNSQFQLSFQKRLNIKLTPNDWSTNNPVISWDSYPRANNGYFALVITKDMYQEEDISFDNDGNPDWDIVFSKYTKDTNVQIYSSDYFVYNAYIPNDQSVLSIKQGDVIRIEVYVLDSSGKLNTKNKTGALFMDSINIIR